MLLRTVTTFHHTAGSVELTAQALPDYLRCITEDNRNFEVTLPSAEASLGARVVIRNLGDGEVSLNPADGSGDTIEFSTGTYTINDRDMVQLQAVTIDSAHGWEVVG